VIAGVVLYFYAQNEAKREAQRQAVARSLITRSDLAITDLRVNSEYGSSELTGVIRNNSKYAVGDITLTFEAFDCPTDVLDARCLSIGKDDNIFLFQDIPGNSARSFESTFNLGNPAPAKGFYKTVVGVKEITAKVD
jgi:hypothetical protein